MSAPYTRYFWKELKEDGRLVDAKWATEDGYDHSDAAICHFHMKFSIELYPERQPPGPCFQLIKLYGIR